MRLLWCAFVLALCGAAEAVELELPATARQLVTRDTPLDRYLAPVGPFAEGALPTQMVEGAVARSAWRIDVAGLTPLQLIAPLRDQLTQADFRIMLDCAAQECGGYDFRFATEVLPAPNMYVNIRNYHVLTGVRDGEAVSILASASSGVSFIQIIRASEAAAASDTPIPPAAPQGLLADGHVVLDGLEFDSGTSELNGGPFEALESLVQILRGRASLRIALVGHTDNVGDLDTNTALSISRADAVRRYLIAQYDIAADRLEVEGLGFLAPLTSNLTEAGRETNRRVEAVVLAE
jgi:OOP family OmpA-OmpF porin